MRTVRLYDLLVGYLITKEIYIVYLIEKKKLLWNSKRQIEMNMMNRF